MSQEIIGRVNRFSAQSRVTPHTGTLLIMGSIDVALQLLSAEGHWELSKDRLESKPNVSRFTFLHVLAALALKKPSSDADCDP